MNTNGGLTDTVPFAIESWEPNHEEKDLLRRIWSDDFDFLFGLGSSIYNYIFAHTPEVKQLFPTIHQWGDEWKESKEFRVQALRFVQTLAHSVKYTYHMGDLSGYLYAIGERHVKYSERGFKPELWDIFLDAMEISLTGHINSIADFSEEQRHAAVQVWRRLALFIITHMKIGYNERIAKTGGK